MCSGRYDPGHQSSVTVIVIRFGVFVDKVVPRQNTPRQLRMVQIDAGIDHRNDYIATCGDLPGAFSLDLGQRPLPVVEGIVWRHFITRRPQSCLHFSGCNAAILWTSSLFCGIRASCGCKDQIVRFSVLYCRIEHECLCRL